MLQKSYHRGPPKGKGKSNNPKGMPKGTKHRTTILRESGIQVSGVTPLEYMLNTLKAAPKLASTRDRQWAAKEAAPYVHRKMPIAIEGGDEDKPIRIAASKLAELSDSDVEALAVAIKKLGIKIVSDE